MRYITYGREIEPVYKRSALNVISSFRSVSSDWAMVIGGTMHVKFAVAEEMRQHFVRSGERSQAN